MHWGTQSALLLVLSLQSAVACDFHTNAYSHPHRGRRMIKRAEGRKEIDWNYDTSYDWHTIKPEYALCHSGTTQSPISLHTTSGHATTHTPNFTYPSTSISGTFYNWHFGPAFDLSLPTPDAFTSLPPLNFDDTTVYLSGWHIHFPSEHIVDGVRAKAEMHMVHVDETGTAASVVGLLIDVAADPDYTSPFFDSLPGLIGFNDTSVVHDVMIKPMQPVEEVGGLRAYWTYRGSLTTPPCSEGLRWFVGGNRLKVGGMQMVKLLESGRFSHRVEQGVWEQGVWEQGVWEQGVWEQGVNV